MITIDFSVLDSVWVKDLYPLYQKSPSDKSRLAEIKQLDHVNLCNSINLSRNTQSYTS